MANDSALIPCALVCDSVAVITLLEKLGYIIYINNAYYFTQKGLDEGLDKDE